MLNEYKDKEYALRGQIDVLEKQSDVLYARLIKQGVDMEKMGYTLPFSDDIEDINVYKIKNLAVQLKNVEKELSEAKEDLKITQSDIYFMEAGNLISQYAKAKYKIKQIDNNNHNIEIVFADDYNTYIDNNKITTIVYELVTRINALPYEKIIYITED